MDVKKKLESVKIEKRAFINGEFVSSIDEQEMKKVSSIDGTIISGITSCNEADVDKAVKVAKKSFE